jgi:hypothetical protein
MRARVVVAVLSAVCMVPSTALAQRFPREVPHAGSIEVGGGFLWTGGYDAGTSSADETGNPPVRSTPLQLFKTDARLRQAIGFDAHIGVHLGPRWSVEGGLQFLKPKLSVQTTDDFESTPDTTIEETITQYLVDGSLVYQFASPRSRLIPFVSGGGGYLRELDDGNASVQTGSEVHGGGGIRYWFGRARKRTGIRVEGRLSARKGSIDLESEKKYRLVPTVSAGLIFLF